MACERQALGPVVNEVKGSNALPVLLGTTRFEPSPTIKNILVTGGAGFIASWLTRHLTLKYECSYRIICFDKLDYCASMSNISCLFSKSNFEFVLGDITDQVSVLRVMQEYEIDTVLHLAAQSHVDLSFGNSFEFTSTNVLGTHCLLECAVKSGIQRFIHMSTDEVHGEVGLDEADLLEDTLLAPTNPYAASKAASEMYVHAYAKSFKLPVIVVRMNNVFGPHQFPEKIIPKFCCLLQEDSALPLHGDGANTRRYLYASDAVDALDTILHRGKVGEVYNVDSKDELSNMDLARKLLNLFKIPVVNQEKYMRHTNDRPFNDQRYAVNGDKLRSLGWKQKTDFEDGLRVTVEWYRAHARSCWSNIEGTLTPFPTLCMPSLDQKSLKRRATVTYHEMPGSSSEKRRRIWNGDKENISKLL